MRDNRVSHGLLRVQVAIAVLPLLTMTACASARLSTTPNKSDATAHVPPSESYGKLPLYFEANRGQTDEQVRFLARGSRSTIFLTPSEAVLAFTDREQPAKGRSQGARFGSEAGGQVIRTVLRMTLIGANPEPAVVGTEELPGKANYFIGSDPANWRTDVPTYAKVRYKDVYPGIDLIYYGNQRQLEYDFVVSPGADPTRIRLGFQGADKLEVDAQSDLVVHTATGVSRHRKPVIYQEVDGAHREIAGGYVLEGARRVGFRVAAYDARRPLIIDPALFYSTYLGGSAVDHASQIAVDGSGNAYVTGVAASTDFPTTAGAAQTAFAGPFADAFVTKFDPTGSVVYSTYLGGSDNDNGFGIAIDAAGNAYITGQTNSGTFPTTAGALRTTLGSNGMAFVTKLSPTGSALMYSTYLGGSGGDTGFGIAVDVAGNAYVTGTTESTDFPTTPGAFQPFNPAGGFRSFVAKLNPLGTGLLYATYLGGTGTDRAFSIAVDTTGNAYVTGDTTSTDFPTTPGTVQPVYPGIGGHMHAFVIQLNALGSAPVYSTYLGGGGGNDQGLGVAVDGGGNAYVVGQAGSSDFPTTPGAFQLALRGAADGFVTKLNSSGSALIYSTYLGGSDVDSVNGIAVDAAGNAYLTGNTASNDFPTTAGAFPAGNTAAKAFVTKLGPTGSSLVYSTYLGGSGEEEGNGIAIDSLPNPNAYVVGITNSTDFPTTAGAFQTTFGGLEDAFVAQIIDVTLLPGRFSARVTGGGTLNVVGGIANFHFIIQREADTGALSGRLQYVNHASGARVQSLTYTSLTIVGNTATFDGDCTLNGTPGCHFTVNVSDNGEPGTNDTFTISYPAPDGGTLRSGNILIRQ